MTEQPDVAQLEQTIRLLQEELAETNREVLVLTVDLEKRVEERTSDLRVAQEELQRKNSELMQLAQSLEQRVAQRTQELALANATLRQEVNERQRTEQEVRRLNESLEQRVQERTHELEIANKELEAFAYSVSHDLRAPLRHLDGFAELLEQSAADKLPDSSRRFLSRIKEATKRMAMLIDSLLAFSRMGRTDLRALKIDSNELVQNTINELRPEIGSRKIEWQIEPLPVVWGDSNLLQQVWNNLLGNAIKYSRNKEVARIEIGCHPEGDELVFHVRDNGDGFDMKYAGKLFGVFQRLHTDDQFEGTGIGLANVRRIIQRHRSRTWAEAELSKGATFYFTLPKPRGER